MEKEPKDLLRSLTKLTVWSSLLVLGSYSNFNIKSDGFIDAGYLEVLPYALPLILILSVIDFLAPKKFFYVCMFAIPAFFALNPFVSFQIIIASILVLPIIFFSSILLDKLTKTPQRKLVLPAIFILSVIITAITLPKQFSDSKLEKKFGSGEYSRQYIYPIASNQSLDARTKIINLVTIPSICQNIIPDYARARCINKENSSINSYINNLFYSLPNMDKDLLDVMCKNSLLTDCKQESLDRYMIHAPDQYRTTIRSIQDDSSLSPETKIYQISELQSMCLGAFMEVYPEYSTTKCIQMENKMKYFGMIALIGSLPSLSTEVVDTICLFDGNPGGCEQYILNVHKSYREDR